jgi:hypothetical protein
MESKSAQNATRHKHPPVLKPSSNLTTYLVIGGVGAALVALGMIFYHHYWLPARADGLVASLNQRFDSSQARSLAREFSGQQDWFFNYLLRRKDVQQRERAMSSIGAVMNQDYAIWEEDEEILISFVQDWRDHLLSIRETAMKTPEAAMAWTVDLASMDHHTHEQYLYGRGGSLQEDLLPMVEKLKSDSAFLDSYLEAFPTNLFLYGVNAVSTDVDGQLLGALLRAHHRYPTVGYSGPEDLKYLYTTHGVMMLIPGYDTMRLAINQVEYSSVEPLDVTSWESLASELEAKTDLQVRFHAKTLFYEGRPARIPDRREYLRPLVEEAMGKTGPLVAFTTDTIYVLPGQLREVLYSKFETGDYNSEPDYETIRLFHFLLTWSAEHSDAWPDEVSTMVEKTCDVLLIPIEENPTADQLRAALEKTFLSGDEFFKQ